MAALRVAAVQASYVLMYRAATLDSVADLAAGAAAQGAQLVVVEHDVAADPDTSSSALPSNQLA
jgi:hypothetical protein